MKKWEHFLQYPIYKGNRLDWKLQKQGFGDIQMTPHYVFCVYSGKRWNPNEGGNNGTDNILVFNHKGKLLNYFHLDNVIGNIAVSEDEKMIYAISYEPEYRVVRYKIGDYL